MVETGYTLAIDTSGAVSVAIAQGARVLATRLDARARHHDEVLLPMIDEVLAEAGAQRSEITRVIAGRGPGPFTGLRVGLVTARSIATVLGAELWGLPSLDAIATQVAANYSEVPGTGKKVQSIGVALDARRKEVYYALYEVQADGSAVRVSEMSVAKPEVAARLIGESSVIVGSGAHLYPEVLPPTAGIVTGSVNGVAVSATNGAETGTTSKVLPDASPATAEPIQHADAGYLILAAQQAAARGEAEIAGGGLHSTEPLYLREADAAKPTKRKSALGLAERSI